MIAFYPIKKKYTDKIFSGEKLCELRKRLPNAETNRVLIYSTYPTAKVVGYAEVKALHKGTVSSVWEELSTVAGIENEDYISYFSGSDDACVIKFNKVYKFVRPFSVNEIFDGFRVPQSFCYVDKGIFGRLSKRKKEIV